jgi:uncharacterized OB-fold protein
MTTNLPRAVPFKEGLFHIAEDASDEAFLIGSRCRDCDWVTFPSRKVCPACVRDDVMEEVHIGKYAELVSFAVVRQAPAGFTPPFIQANVKIDEGPVFFTHIDGVVPSEDALRVGQRMRLVIKPIRRDSEGNEILAWAYRPLDEQNN